MKLLPHVPLECGYGDVGVVALDVLVYVVVAVLVVDSGSGMCKAGFAGAFPLVWSCLSSSGPRCSASRPV